jgi:predicted dehydrogenase
VQFPTEGPLRIGILGSGFIANFHLQALLGVRNARVAGVFSPTPANRLALAKKANELRLGPYATYDSVESLVESEEVDAVWVLGPNDTRLDHMRAISEAVEGGASLLGVACEKPLARNLVEAREMLRLAEGAGLNHGYLENQVFSTAVQRGKDVIWRRGVPAAGRPYLARSSEEHSGPHAPWFWHDVPQRRGGPLPSHRARQGS